MRALMTLTFIALTATSVGAQDANQNTVQAMPEERNQLSKTEQSTQRIVIEDAGSRVSELRVGGRTRSITVQPKTGTALPAYEMRTSDGARVWNFGRF